MGCVVLCVTLTVCLCNVCICLEGKEEEESLDDVRGL